MQASLEKSCNLNNDGTSHCIIILCWGKILESLDSYMNIHYNQNDAVESFYHQDAEIKLKSHLVPSREQVNTAETGNNPWERIQLK